MSEWVEENNLEISVPEKSFLKISNNTDFSKCYKPYLLKKIDKKKGTNLSISEDVRKFFKQSFTGILSWEGDGGAIVTYESEECSYVTLVLDLIDTLLDFFVEPDGDKVKNYIRASFHNIEDTIIFVKENDLVYVSGFLFCRGYKYFDEKEVPFQEGAFVCDKYDFEAKYTGHRKTLENILQAEKELNEKCQSFYKTYFTYSHEDFFKKAISGYEENIIDILEDDFLSNLAFIQDYQEKYKKVKQFGVKKGWVSNKV